MMSKTISQHTWKILNEMRPSRPVEKTPDELRAEALERLSEMDYALRPVAPLSPAARKAAGYAPREESER